MGAYVSCRIPVSNLFPLPPQVCFVTNPLWVAKTRLQLQQRQVLAASSAATAAVRSWPSGCLYMCV